MGSNSFDNLSRFFDRVKSIGFLERLFSWKSIKQLSYDAYEEYKSFDKVLTVKNQELNSLTVDHRELLNNFNNLNKNYSKLDLDYQLLKGNYDRLLDEKMAKELIIAEYHTTEDQRKQDYETKVAALNTLYEQQEKALQNIQEIREKEITDKYEQLKQTWVNHEKEVEDYIRGICKHCQLEYVDKEKLPFKGKPDNTIKICGEYLIFDAKSPQSDDLENFPSYIKTQTESVKKYAKEESVKKDIFLVVPSSTIHIIDQFHYNMAEYNVYIVTLDSLEPIIMCLKKIEDYEFAEQLSPEDRDTICRIIGRFTHAVKRRMQIDSYFCNQTMEILTHVNELPSEMYDRVLDFEKSDKLNPPQEKRAKAISDAELKKSSKVIKEELEANSVSTESLQETIKQIPLYTKES